MPQVLQCGKRMLTLSAVLMMASALVAAPVQRDDACLAATSELPGFFAGPWQLVGELTLHNLTGDTVAYAFMFARPQEQSKGGVQEDSPAQFVAKARAELAGRGGIVSADAPELYGEDRFASMVISADDTEPPVLRCFKGLPPQVVKESDALALAAKSGGAGAWRVRHCLMLGLLDEAFEIEAVSGVAEPLVVDLRTHTVVTHTAAQAQAASKQAVAPDSERVRKCQEAWQPYRAAGKAALAPPGTTPAAGGVRKITAVDEPSIQPLLPNPSGK